MTTTENASAFTMVTMKYLCKITTGPLFLSENTMYVNTFSDPLLSVCCGVIVDRQCLLLVGLCETVSTSLRVSFTSSESSREWKYIQTLNHLLVITNDVSYTIVFIL